MREKKVLPLHSLKGSSSHESPVQPKMASSVGNQSLLSQLGTGHAMPEPVQAKMEESFGADFSGVRLFESPVVSDNGAQAVASGKNIAFAPGQLDLNSSKGLGLLGHELSHVASQARGEVSGHGFVNDSSLEHKADAEGAKAASAFDSLSGQTLTPMSTAGAPASPAGPMQAKKEEPKRKLPTTPYQRFKHAVDAEYKNGGNLHTRIHTLRDVYDERAVYGKNFGHNTKDYQDSGYAYNDMDTFMASAIDIGKNSNIYNQNFGVNWHVSNYDTSDESAQERVKDYKKDRNRLWMGQYTTDTFVGKKAIAEQKQALKEWAAKKKALKHDLRKNYKDAEKAFRLKQRMEEKLRRQHPDDY